MLSYTRTEKYSITTLAIALRVRITARYTIFSRHAGSVRRCQYIAKDDDRDQDSDLDADGGSTLHLVMVKSKRLSVIGRYSPMATARM